MTKLIGEFSAALRWRRICAASAALCAFTCVPHSAIGAAGATADVPEAVAPYVHILSPVMEQCLPGPDVAVTVETGGVGFTPCGCSLHFMLDNEPFEVQYDPSHPHVFQDVRPGTHTVRAYATDAQHQAIPGTLNYVTFSVAYPDEENRLEFNEPLLTYNLPQGEYRGIDSGDLTINFLVDGTVMARRGYRVNYYVDGRRYVVSDCLTRHVKGLAPGFHTVRVDLVDERNRVVPGPFNSTERVVLLSPEKVSGTLAPGEKVPEQPTIDSIHGAMTMGSPWVPYADTVGAPPRSGKATGAQQTISVAREGAPSVRKSETQVREDVKDVSIEPAQVPSRGQGVDVTGPSVKLPDSTGAVDLDHAAGPPVKIERHDGSASATPVTTIQKTVTRTNHNETTTDNGQRAKSDQDAGGVVKPSSNTVTESARTSTTTSSSELAPIKSKP